MTCIISLLAARGIIRPWDYSVKAAPAAQRYAPRNRRTSGARSAVKRWRSGPTSLTGVQEVRPHQFKAHGHVLRRMVRLRQGLRRRREVRKADEGREKIIRPFSSSPYLVVADIIRYAVKPSSCLMSLYHRTRHPHDSYGVNEFGPAIAWP